jgi:hypothetical protein
MITNELLPFAGNGAGLHSLVTSPELVTASPANRVKREFGVPSEASNGS